MKIFSELKKVTNILEQYDNGWAICGGVAASIYRKSPRFTDDIDIALVDSEKMSAEELATKVVNKLGYEEIIGFIPKPGEQYEQVKGLICCRSREKERFVGIDFLLPVFFWIPRAIKTAQKNRLDFGFANLPTVTPEDLIISKLVALAGTPDRPYDRDDILEIIDCQKLDLDYLLKQIKEQEISVEQSILDKLK